MLSIMLGYSEEEYLNLGADYKEINQDLKIEINHVSSYVTSFCVYIK